MELDKLPGFREALDEACVKQDALRLMSCLNVKRKVCGISIRLMTRNDFLILIAASSPFVCYNRAPTNGDCAQFLWVLTSGFQFFRKLPRLRFITWIENRVRRRWTRSIKRLNFDQCCEEIHKYVDDIFMDHPPTVERKGCEKSESTECFAVGIDMAIAKETGLSVMEISNLPLPYIYQCLRHIRRMNGDNVTNVRSNRVRKQFTRDYIASLNKEGK